MNKRTILILLSVILVCVLCVWCSSHIDQTPASVLSTEPNETSTTSAINADVHINEVVDAYNELVAKHNSDVTAYNESVKVIVETNAVLDRTIATARAILDAGDIPFDPQTAINLTQALQLAIEVRMDDPTELLLKETIGVQEDATVSELEDLRSRINVLMEDVQNDTVPAPLETPDYTDVIAGILDAQTAYEISVKIQKQLTAPNDEFVVERISQIDSILSFAAVTKYNDPNGLLGTEGGYIGCIYFSDRRVDKEKLNLKPSEYDVITMGTIGGGAIEVYSSTDEAERRNEYLSSYDNTTLNPGSHVVVGTLVIRTSSMLTAEQQQELTNDIITALTELIEE